MDRLRVGFSPCPNDTFAFDALVHGKVPFDVPIEPVIEDVEALNARASGPPARRLPVTKLSVAVALELLEDVRILGAGAALGRGCGPLVVTRPGRARRLSDLAGAKVAVPGLRTTAVLLYEVFGPPGTMVPMRFDRVLGAVEAGAADAALLIHELRFTYGARGLCCVADLGVLWEAETGLPLPLGIVAARRSLPREVADRFSAALAASVRHARAHPGAPSRFVAAHAQAMDPDVCRRHIDLYVNAYTEDLGDEGRRAIAALAARAKAAGRPVAGVDPFA